MPSKTTKFTRKLPDHVTDELVRVLLQETEFLAFNDLFEKIYERLKARNAVSGGEEMLRLRAYEKLQTLVNRGFIEKFEKSYKQVEKLKEFAQEREILPAE